CRRAWIAGRRERRADRAAGATGVAVAALREAGRVAVARRSSPGAETPTGRPAGRPVVRRDNDERTVLLRLVDEILQTLARTEGRNLGSLDLDRGAGLRVAAFTGSALADFEAAEAGER